MNLWFWFVSTGWLHLMILIGVFVTAWLAIKWKKIDWFNRFGAIAVIVLVFHVMEEWVLPGGFHYIYNYDKLSGVGTNFSAYPMNQLTDMITNLGGAIIGVALLLTFGLNKGAGIAIGLFSLFEVIIHLLLSGKSLRYFSSLGQTAFYAPGLNTALFGFLPLAVFYLLAFIYSKPYPNLKQWICAVLSLISLSFFLVNLPEMLLKDENSPYVFTNHGFYEQFLNGNAQEGLSGATIASIFLGCVIIVIIVALFINFFAIKKRTFNDLNEVLKKVFNG